MSSDPFDGTVEVSKRETVADGVVELTFAAIDEEALPSWEPGAHIEIVVDDDLIRHYSLCGEPTDPTWTVAVLQARDSRGGSKLVHERLNEGTTVRVRGPRNRFTQIPAKSYTFIAGGIGITPLLPMLRRADRDGIDWNLHYGGRTRDAMAYATELANQFADRVTLHPQDETGLLPLDTILAEIDADTAVYACGPEPMLTAIEERANDATWSLHVERFVAAKLADASENTPVEVTIASTGQSLTVPADQSILEAVEQAGIFALSSCREGICGTCETQVISGRPDHRDSYLTDQERESGDVMMICVSRANSPLELDL